MKIIDWLELERHSRIEILGATMNNIDVWPRAVFQMNEMRFGIPEIDNLMAPLDLHKCTPGPGKWKRRWNVPVEGVEDLGPIPTVQIQVAWHLLEEN